MTEEQFEWTADKFREYASFAQGNGLRVGPENHYGPARALSNQLKVAEAVDSAAYGVLLQFGNWIADPDDCDAAIARLVMHTHIDARHCSLNLDEVLKPLFDADYQGLYAAEHHTGVDEYAEVAVQLAQARKALRAKATM